MIKVCDLMHKGVLFCYPDTNLMDVAKIMSTSRIRSVVVIDESGDVWGLISNMDLLRCYGKDLESFRAEEIMRPYKMEVNPQAPIEDAIRLMKQQKFEHLIIVDPHAGPKRPIGILTSYDIVQYMSGLKFGSLEYRLTLHTDE